MFKPNAKKILPLLALVLCACGTQVPAPSKPVEVQQAKLPPAPADVMVKQQANFRQNLLDFSSVKLTAPMPSSTSSEPASK